MKNNWNERAVGEIVTIMPMASEEIGRAHV